METLASFRLVVDVGLVDFPNVGAGGQLRPTGPRVVFMAALLACRLRVFLQVHLRHHAAAGSAFRFRLPQSSHPQEERTGAVELYRPLLPEW